MFRIHKWNRMTNGMSMNHIHIRMSFWNSKGCRLLFFHHDFYCVRHTVFFFPCFLNFFHQIKYWNRFKKKGLRIVWMKFDTKESRNFLMKFCYALIKNSWNCFSFWLKNTNNLLLIQLSPIFNQIFIQLYFIIQ